MRTLACQLKRIARHVHRLSIILTIGCVFSASSAHADPVARFLNWINRHRLERENREIGRQLKALAKSVAKDAASLQTVDFEYRSARMRAHDVLRNFFRSPTLQQTEVLIADHLSENSFGEAVRRLDQARDRYIEAYGFEALLKIEFSDRFFEASVEAVRQSMAKVSAQPMTDALRLSPLGYSLTEVRNDLIVMELSVLPDPAMQKVYDDLVAQKRTIFETVVGQMSREALAIRTFETDEAESFRNLQISLVAQQTLVVPTCEGQFRSTL